MYKQLPFHQQLRHNRKQHGWSQEDVAARVGSDIKTVSRWELGKAFPNPYYRQKLAELFGKNIDELGLIEVPTEYGNFDLPPDDPPNWLTESAIGRMKKKFPQVKKVRGELHFGVVGWGYWGPKIARNLDALSRSKVTIVADTDEHRLAPLVAGQSGVRITSQPEEVFRSDVDAVIIATPIHTHYSLAKAALSQGKHVLVEKPLTSNVIEAEELVALAERQKRILMVGHTFEYSPPINELRKLVQNGDLGKIYCVEMERLNLGMFRSDINVIWDLAPHDVSILLYVFEQRPERISVRAYTNLQPHIHDIAHLDLEFTNGMNAHIHVSWLHPEKIRRITVIGDLRMAVFDDTNPAQMLKVYNKGIDLHADLRVSYRYGAITIPHVDWIEPLRLECEDFANAIRSGIQPRSHGGIGLEVVRILAAAQDALESQGKG